MNDCLNVSRFVDNTLNELKKLISLLFDKITPKKDGRLERPKDDV